MSYSKLPEQQKRQFAKNLVARRRAYELWTRQQIIAGSKDILLVGDQPGPGAPQTDDYHHTPFYANKNSGGWISAALVLAEISEDRLLWVNSRTWDGKPTDSLVLHLDRWISIFALGNNAAKWLTTNGRTDFIKVLHPQAHKRFHAQTPYDLLAHLQILHAVPA